MNWNTSMLWAALAIGCIGAGLGCTKPSDSPKATPAGVNEVAPANTTDSK